MKQLLLLLFAIVVLAQAKHQDSALSDNFQKEFDELLAPMMDEFVELKQLMEQVKQHEKTHQIVTMAFAERMSKVPQHCLPNTEPLLAAWSMDMGACSNMSGTLEVAAELLENVTSWVYKASWTIGDIVYDFINCGAINPVTAVKCMVNDISDLKDTINAYKPIVLKFKHQIADVFDTLRIEFDDCIGIRSQVHTTARLIVTNARVCQQNKN